MPFIYWPKLLESDSQPWVALGAALAALTFWPRDWKPQLVRTWLPVALAVACALAYALRETDGALVARYFGILGTFAVLWLVASRGGEESFGRAVRVSIAIWFAVGAYQVVALRLGLPIDFLGRFVAGRGGVPGLTAEPSFYGSISVIQLMYLLAEEDWRKNRWFVGLAVLSVLISGSILSYLFLLVPLARLRLRWILAGTLALLAISTQGARISDSGFFNRLATLNPVEIVSDPVRLLNRDASTNLRFGHIKFTLYDEIGDLALLRGNTSFRQEYNRWAFAQRGFIYNESDYVLTSLGELVFRSGVFGLLLALTLLRYSWLSVPTLRLRLEKLAMVMLCFLSPVSLANPFFTVYIARQARA